MKNFNAWHFLIGILSVYAILFFVKTDIFWSSSIFFKNTIIKIIPVFVFIFILMVVINRYVDNKFIIKHIRGNKIKSWIYIIIGGIISTGPMYMWYPLLKDLRDKGVSNGELASFLYNRSIKPAFLPLIVLYFGLKYTVVLTITIILISFLQAFIVEIFAPFEEQN